MSTPSAAVEKYALPRVHQYIQAVEVAYNVSLKFWLDFRPDGQGGTSLVVFCWGAGDAFDLIPNGVPPRAVAVYPNEPAGLEEALYYSVMTVAMYLDKVKEPLGPRPSL